MAEYEKTIAQMIGKEEGGISVWLVEQEPQSLSESAQIAVTRAKHLFLTVLESVESRAKVLADSVPRRARSSYTVPGDTASSLESNFPHSLLETFDLFLT